MPCYTGSSADGSDIKEFEGLDVSPNGKYFGSEPVNDDGIFLSRIEGMSRRERRAYTRKNKLR